MYLRLVFSFPAKGGIVGLSKVVVARTTNRAVACYRHTALHNWRRDEYLYEIFYITIKMFK